VQRHRQPGPDRGNIDSSWPCGIKVKFPFLLMQLLATTRQHDWVVNKGKVLSVEEKVTMVWNVENWKKKKKKKEEEEADMCREFCLLNATILCLQYSSFLFVLNLNCNLHLKINHIVKILISMLTLSWNIFPSLLPYVSFIMTGILTPLSWRYNGLLV